MLWIIWTIGWFLACSSEQVLYEWSCYKFNIKRYKPGEEFIRLICFGLWLIGISKFW